MPAQLPKNLKENSKIGLICPAGGFDDYKPIKLVVKYLEKLNYKVILGSSLIASKKYLNYLSGPDNKRKQDFLKFWNDKNVDAIFCLRGGYGCLRFVKDIDFNKLRKTKKVLLGFSDVTILLLAVYKKCNLLTFHGPLLGYKFINYNLKSVHNLTEKYLWELLKNPNFKFYYSFKSKGIVINRGKAKGRLLGGNITDICSMIGSDLLPNFKGSILFLEEVHEEPYKIDRLLTQIDNANIFRVVNGIIFCSFEKCNFKNNHEIVLLLKQKVKKYKVPIIFNFPIGHGIKNYTVPIGQKVVLDADNVSLYTA